MPIVTRNTVMFRPRQTATRIRTLIPSTCLPCLPNSHVTVERVPVVAARLRSFHQALSAYRNHPTSSSSSSSNSRSSPHLPHLFANGPRPSPPQAATALPFSTSLLLSSSSRRQNNNNSKASRRSFTTIESIVSQRPKMGLANYDLPPPPQGKYPAKAHARKVAEHIRATTANGDVAEEGVIYLEAQKTHMVEDDDQAQHFRQRRFFYYLSGCSLPDSYVCYNIKEDHLTLFIPPVDPEDVIWSGMPLTPKEAMEKYDIDACLTSDKVNAYLASPKTPHSTIYAIPKQVAEHVTFLSFNKTNFDVLKGAIEKCRVVKDEFEIGLIRHANAISSHAHTEVMKMVKEARNERELMGTFIGACISNGGREQAYGCICASGTNAATLHYVHNDLNLSNKYNLLIDAGCEYECYCSDITRTYPLKGSFTKESKQIYDIVDEMQSECMKMLKADIMWEDVHARAHEVAIDGLRKLGILKGGNKQEIFDSRVSTVFFPHGLGHYLGMDTHDCGGNANYDDPDPMFKYLRVRGKVPAGAVVTNEPGIYFCRFIIEPALKDEKFSKFIDKDVLDKYWDVGGVRIEDDIWIKEDGHENLTTAPRTWEDVEALINGWERDVSAEESLGRRLAESVLQGMNLKF